MEYEKIREFLSDKEHEQWMFWSKSVAKDIEQALKSLEDNHAEDTQAYRALKNRLDRWKEYWVPYSQLTEEIKEYDREWADKILDVLPFKCPIYQCGSIMETDELPLPKGMDPDMFPDGRAGDEQLPDLVCTNCSGRYRFQGFDSDMKCPNCKIGCEQYGDYKSIGQCPKCKGLFTTKDGGIVDALSFTVYSPK